MTKLFLAAALTLGLMFAGATAEAMGHKVKFRHAHAHNIFSRHGRDRATTCVPNAAGFCTQPHI